ncbi:MAG: biotin transporter BioY, partial [Clostridia bacterium]
SLFVVLMIAGATLRIPLGFIDVTFQAFFAVMAGLLLGPGKAALAMSLYLLLGLFGFPVFASGGGAGYVLMPSFGFIPGFILGGFVTGKLAAGSAGKGWLILLSIVIGMLSIYLIGIPYMSMILRFYLDRAEYTLPVVAASMVLYLCKDILLCIPAAIIARRAGSLFP